MQILWVTSAAFRHVTYPYTTIHRAVDFSAPIGTPLVAPISGRTVWDFTVGGGNVLWVVNDDLAARLVHLDTFLVRDGVWVEVGTEVALSGNTGILTTGPHLHLEIWRRGAQPADTVLTDSQWIRENVLSESKGFARIPYVNYLTDTPQEETHMKVFYHEIVTQPWMRTLLDSKFRKYTLAIKAVNPRVPDAYPNHKIIGRMIIKGAQNDAWEHSLIDRGAGGAEEYFRVLMPYYQERKGIVTVWEGPNEPALDTKQQCQNLVNFYKRWTEMMHDEGLLAAGFQASVSQPQVKAADPASDKWQILAPIYYMVDLRTRHSYWLPRGVQAPSTGPTDIWTALRHRLDEAELIALGHKSTDFPQLFITEGGVDGGVYRYKVGVGWRGLCSEEQYKQELTEWYKELDKDSYVGGGCLFTVGPTTDWATFEEAQSMAEWQANQAGGGILYNSTPMATPTPVTPTPEPEPGLPIDELKKPDMTPKKLVDKARWWTEEAMRQHSAGEYAFEKKIMDSNVELLLSIYGML